MIDWPFADPRNVAVVTVKNIMNGVAPILRVTHDLDDGAWQFLVWVTPDIDDAAIMSLEEMTISDPTILELVDLP